MARINTHHITYKPEWTVDITGQMHRLLTTIQRTRTTEEQYARITGFIHALVHEWNRMRRDLDIKSEKDFNNEHS